MATVSTKVKMSISVRLIYREHLIGQITKLYLLDCKFTLLPAIDTLGLVLYLSYTAGPESDA